MQAVIKTAGISPKVWVPAAGQIIVGIVFLALGLVVEGKTAIATGLGTAVVGFSAKPGDVVLEKPVVRDEPPFTG